MSRPAPRSPRSRWLLGLAVPAAVSTVGLTAGGGCDTKSDQADRAVDDNLRQAEADPADAHKFLDAAAKRGDASLPEQLRAKALLASAEMRQASTLAQTALANSAQIDRVGREILGLTGAVAADNQAIATLGKYQPQPALDAVKQQQTDIAGADGKPWYTSDNGALAAAAPTDKAVADLQAQASQLDQQVKAETDQRNELLAKSDQLGMDSARERHQKSADLFVQGADVRKQAADLAVKIDQDAATAARVREDLALQTAQQGSLQAANKGADDRAADVNQNWAAVQEQIKAVKAHSGTVLGDAGDAAAGAPEPGKGATTITGKAAEMARLVKQNAGVRAEAEAHYGAAISFYTDAVDRATQLGTTLSGLLNGPERPERADRDAWAAEKAATDLGQFNFLLAAARLDRAEFYARAAAETKGVADLSASVRATLDAAGQTAPAGLEDSNGEASVTTQKDQKQARDGFTAAVEGLSNLTDGTAAAEVKQGAAAELVAAQYGWALLESAAGDAQEATTHLQAATTARVNAAVLNAPLPPGMPDLVLPAMMVTPASGGSAAAGTAAGVSGSVVGTYKAQQGDVGKPLSATMSMALLADGTATLEMVLQGNETSLPSIVKKSEGTYTADAEKVTVTFVSGDGKPIPASDPKKTLVLTREAGDKQLSAAGVAPFVRQD